VKTGALASALMILGVPQADPEVVLAGDGAAMGRDGKASSDSVSSGVSLTCLGLETGTDVASDGKGSGAPSSS